MTANDTYVYHRRGLALRNSTRLDTLQLLRLFADAASGWPVEGLRVWVRYSRGADYSGTCYDLEGRILVNIGRNVVYPYDLQTHLARARQESDGWSKPIFTLQLADACQLALFIFLHECCHWLIRRAGRNPRQKESTCDRFAARILVDYLGCQVHDANGRAVDRNHWDFQDFSALLAARTSPQSRTPSP